MSPPMTPLTTGLCSYCIEVLAPASRWWGLCRLTFELSGRRRQDARPGLVKMYRVPPDRAWWPAVGAPLERGVRQHFAGTIERQIS